MKDFFAKYFGLVGIVLYSVIAVIIRIPVAFVLLGAVVAISLLWNPITRRSDSPDWVARLYDWYNAQ